MKIKVIIPNSGMDRNTLNEREKMFSKVLCKNSHISVDCIEYGPRSIESNTDEILAGIPLIRQCIKAEQQGFDAIVIYCFSDLAIDAIRENVSIPVIGPGEIALAIADVISKRFTVITTLDENAPRTERRLMRNNIAKEKMVSIRALNIPVIKLREDSDTTKMYLEKVCKESIEKDRIDTIVLGCLGLAQYGDFLKEKYDIQIIDPAFVAVAYAEMCVKLQLTHNKRNYPKYERVVGNGI